MSVLGLIIDPLSHAFMRNGLLEILLLSVASGLMGPFVVHRNLTFFSHALTHTIFPMLVLALVLRFPPTLGAAAGVLLTIALVFGLQRQSDVGKDSAVGIVFVGLFALGVILVGLFRIKNPDVNAALTGNLLGVGQSDLVSSGIFVAVIALVVFGLYRPFALVSFDPVSAQALGLPVQLLDMILLVLVGTTAVMGVSAIGVILLVAILVTPAASAGMWVRHIPHIMLLAGILSAIAGVVGLYIAYYVPITPAAIVVLGLTLLFMASALFSPRGVFSRPSRLVVEPV